MQMVAVGYNCWELVGGATCKIGGVSDSQKCKLEGHIPVPFFFFLSFLFFSLPSIFSLTL